MRAYNFAIYIYWMHEFIYYDLSYISVRVRLILQMVLQTRIRERDYSILINVDSKKKLCTTCVTTVAMVIAYLTIIMTPACCTAPFSRDGRWLPVQLITPLQTCYLPVSFVTCYKEKCAQSVCGIIVMQ